METFVNVMLLFMFLAFVLVIISAFTPKTAFFLKEPTKQKAICSWFGICLACMIIIFIFVPGDEKELFEIKGTPLAYLEIKKDETIRAAIKRNRLDVTIVANAEQSKATQDDLLATVMTAAIDYQKASGLPVVTVNLLSQRASNPYGELSLATATYIPDEKGYSGEQEIGPWDTLMAVDRGFTNQELEYMRNWADMRTQFMNANETVNDEALDAAISKKMGIEAGSLTPHYNFMAKPKTDDE